MTQNLPSDPKPMLSVLIVSYNVLDALKPCLEAIKPLHDNGDTEIWIIDNASRDASAEWVAQQPWLHLIRNSENRGFAVAVNQGIEQTKGAYILLLNPDTIPSVSVIEDMLAFMADHTDCGTAGAQLLHPDGSPQMSYHNFPTPWTFVAESLFFKWIKAEQKRFEEPVSVDAVVGACMMIRRKAIETIGLLDERFFLYSEELDWCLRAHQKGWAIYLLPESQIRHGLALSSRDHPGNAFVELYCSRRLYMEKHFSCSGRWIAQTGLVTGVLLRVLIWGTLRWITSKPDKRKATDLKYIQNKAVLCWYLSGCPNPSRT